MTPRFLESGHDQLLAIEKKYYPFFDKFDCNINLVPFSGISMEEYLENEKPDAIVFAGGYRLYTKEISEFETKFLKEVLKKNLQLLDGSLIIQKMVVLKLDKILENKQLDQD